MMLSIVTHNELPSGTISKINIQIIQKQIWAKCIVLNLGPFSALCSVLAQRAVLSIPIPTLPDAELLSSMKNQFNGALAFYVVFLLFIFFLQINRDLALVCCLYMTGKRSLVRLNVRSRICWFDVMSVNVSYRVRSRILRQNSHVAQQRLSTDQVKLDIVCIHSKQELSWASGFNQKTEVTGGNDTVFFLSHLPSSILDARTCTFAHQVSPSAVCRPTQSMIFVWPKYVSLLFYPII